MAELKAIENSSEQKANPSGEEEVSLLLYTIKHLSRLFLLDKIENQRIFVCFGVLLVILR